MSLKEYLDGELRQLEVAGLLRRRAAGVPPTPELVDVCTNDYLGYARRVVSRETSVRAGAGASRLIFGTDPSHLALERELARWVGAEAALLFPTGFSANLGVISGLAHEGDLVISDALNHASIIDGCRLSKARIVVAPHLDLAATDRALATAVPGRRWVVTESYFSMDADSPDLVSLRRLCDERGAFLIVDEAHALGVFGPEGSGLARASGVTADVLVGTLGKAVGVQGAFVAGSSELADLLYTRARSFVFTTAPSPTLVELTSNAVRLVIADEASRAKLVRLSAFLERRLAPKAGITPARRHGPIFPIFAGTPGRAVAMAAALRDRGFLAQAIRPPTVPSGSSRLRIALHADMTEATVERLANALLDVCAAS
ncbi:MAG TPA: 8-amino-7-oxononanoate synthase [Polyangiaceae bacterium]|nr:8-amino-7-oxononanoate synthase [Polyangiaceae bacterium]